MSIGIPLVLSNEPEELRQTLIEMGLDDRINFLLSIKKGDYVLVEDNGKRIKSEVGGVIHYIFEIPRIEKKVCYRFRAKDFDPNIKLDSIVYDVPADRIFPLNNT